MGTIQEGEGSMRNDPHIKVYKYKKLGEIIPYLRDVYHASEDALFFVPGTEDVSLFASLVGEDEYFGSGNPRYRHWEAVPRWLAREAGKTIPLNILDPYRRWMVLQDIFRRERATYPSEIPDGLRKSGFFPFVEKALRYCLREEISPTDFEKTLGCGGCTPEGKCRIPQVLSSWVCVLLKRYREFLSPSGWYDGAAASTLARYILEDTGDSVTPRPLVLAGFLTFTRAQQRLLKTLHGRGFPLTIFHPECTWEYPLFASQEEEMSCSYERIGTDEPFQVVTCVCGDRRVEWATIARQFQLWARGEGDLTPHDAFPGWEGIGVTVASDILPLAQEVLERYRVPYNLVWGKSLAETRFGDLVNRFLKVVGGGWPTRETAYFFTDALVYGDDFPLVHALTIAPRGVREWCDFFRETGLEEKTWKAWLALGGIFRKPATALGILETFEHILREGLDLAVRASSLGKDDEETDRTVWEVSQGLAEIAHTIVSLRETERSFPLTALEYEGGEALSFLTTWLSRSRLLPAPARRGCLTLYVDTPPPFARHPVMVVTSAESSRYPGHEEISPFESAGETLFSPRDSREHAYARFQRLIACGERLTVLTRAIQNEEGKPIEPSSFMAEIFQPSAYLSQKSWGVLCGEIKCSLGEMPGSRERYFPSVEISTEGDAVPRALPRISNPSLDVGFLSDLDDWLECPFFVACRRLYRLRARVRPGVDRLKLGILIHKMWADVPVEAFFNGERLYKNLVDGLHTHIKEVYPEFATRRFRRHRKSLERTLVALARESEAYQCQGGQSPLEDRREYELEPLSVGGVTFHGRCDRVLIFPGNRCFLFDYKGGKSENSRGKRQLAAYALFLQKNEKLNPIGWAYLCHGDGMVISCMEEGRGNSPAAVMEKAHQGIEEMARGIREHQWDPNPQSSLCRTCEFSLLCRKDEGILVEEDDDA